MIQNLVQILYYSIFKGGLFCTLLSPDFFCLFLIMLYAMIKLVTYLVSQSLSSTYFQMIGDAVAAHHTEPLFQSTC